MTDPFTNAGDDYDSRRQAARHNRERARAWVRTVLQDYYEEALIDMLLDVVRAKGVQDHYKAKFEREVAADRILAGAADVPEPLK